MSLVSNSNQSRPSVIFSPSVAFSFLLAGGIILVLARKAISELRSPVSSEVASANRRYTLLDLSSTQENKRSSHINGKRQHMEPIRLTEPLEEPWETTLENWVGQVEKGSPEYNDRVTASKKIQECRAGEIRLDLSHTRIHSFEGIEEILADLGPSCVILLPPTLTHKSLTTL